MSVSPPPLITPIGRTARRQTRVASEAVLVVGAIATVAAAAVLGWVGLWSGLAATLVVLGFFYTGLTPLKLTGMMGEGAAFGLMVLLLNYTLRLVVAMAVLVSLGRAGLLHGGALGLTIIGCAVAWTLGQGWVGLRQSDPLDIPDFVAPDIPDLSAPEQDPRTLDL